MSAATFSTSTTEVYTPAGVLLISVFLFTEQLYFTEANIGAVILPIAMVLASLDLTAGGRLFGAAALASAAWAVVFGGIIVRGNPAAGSAAPQSLPYYDIRGVAVCAYYACCITVLLGILP